MKISLEQKDIINAIETHLKSVGMLPKDNSNMTYKLDVSFTKGRKDNGLSCEIDLDLIPNVINSEPKNIISSEDTTEDCYRREVKDEELEEQLEFNFDDNKLDILNDQEVKDNFNEDLSSPREPIFA